MQFSAGDRVGSYEIVGALGAGGMGTVYRARDPRLGRDIAIKVLQERLVSRREYLDQFAQEARSASALNHPNIVTIHDIGEVRSAPFIAMELVEGKRLRDLLREGPLPLRKVLQIATQLADGLAAAHHRGIVHRDLKPENVMVTRDGLVKILDFGVALLRAEGTDDETTSRIIPGESESPAVIGTAAYMSPEQASGGSTDFHSDQFSFGTILYEMVTGKLPFARATTFDTLAAIVHEDPIAADELNPRIPPPLRWTIDRCLAKDPSDRYASTRDLARDLQTIRDHLSEATTADTMRRLMTPSRRRGAFIGAAAALVVILAAGLWLNFRRPEPIAPSASRQSLAVLPFDDLSGMVDGDRFARGFAETVSARLAKSSEIEVIPPSRVARGEQDLALLARELGADIFLRGSIQRSGQKMRVNYAVVQSRGTTIAGDTVTGGAEDVFQLQDDVAASVAAGLRIRAGATAIPTGLANAEDQDIYLRALGHLQSYDDPAQVDRAIGLLEDLSARNPKAALVRATLGRAYLAKYRLTLDQTWNDRAVIASNEARALDPTLPEVHQTLGETKLIAGAHDEAIGDFQHALSLQPHSVDTVLSLADAYAAANRNEEAETTFRRAIGISPSWWSVYNRLGTFYFTRGQYGDARAMYAEAVRRNPDSRFAQSNLGAVQMMLGDFGAALDAFSKTIHTGADAAAFSNLGTSLYYLGRFPESVQAYRTGVEMRPQEATTWANLGDAHRAMGETDPSRKAYERAIQLAEADLKINSKRGGTHGTLARCYAKLGKEELARKHIRVALDLEPKNPYRMVQAAMVDNLAGNEAVAAQWLERAIEAGYNRAFAEREPDFQNLVRKNVLPPPLQITRATANR